MSSYRLYWVARELGYQSLSRPLAGIMRARSSPAATPMPQGVPAGTTRQANKYISPNGRNCDIEGEYFDSSVENPHKHPRVPEGSE